jgi:hypothetical protein
MKNVFFVLAFSAISIVTNAQFTRGGGGAFTVGMQMWPVDELKAFAPDGPTISTNSFSLGGYGYWQFNDWIFGFKGAGIYGSEKLDDNYSYRMTGGYFAVDFGYKVVNSNKFFVYPLIGIGWGGVGYNISEKFSLDLANPDATKPVIYGGEYSWSNVVFDVGVRIEQLFGVRSDENGSGGGLVGIEVGYMFSPSSSDWRTSTNATINNAPEYSLNGLYARVVIGGFGGSLK